MRWVSLKEQDTRRAGEVGMGAFECDRSVLALPTDNGAVSCNPDRIETSDRDTFHIRA